MIKTHEFVNLPRSTRKKDDELYNKEQGEAGESLNSRTLS